MADLNQQQANRNGKIPHTSLLRIAQDNQRRYRMKKPSLVDLKHKISAGTLEVGEKERKTHRDIRLEDKEAYDSQNEILVGSPRNVHGIKWSLVVACLMSLSFLVGLDGTITPSVQVTFVKEFESVRTLAFNSVAFFLGAGATALTWNQVYGLFNSKWTLITAVLVYIVGSTVSGAAPNDNSLIVGRTISGVGACGMATGIWTVLARSTTEHERPTYVTLQAVACCIGIILGPIIGGAFAQSHATWRWGYYIQLCVAAIFAPILLLLMPSNNPLPKIDLRSKVASIDILGSALLIGSLLTFVLAINFGGLTYSWHSGAIIVLWVISGLCFVSFCIQQIFGWLAHQRLFPGGMIKNLQLPALFLLQGCSSTGFFVSCYFIPLYFQYVRNETPLLAGVHLLPLVIPICVFAALSTQVIRKTNLWLPLCFFGGAMILAGGSLMYTVDAYTSIAKVYGCSILIGAGVGSYILVPFHAYQEFVSPASTTEIVALIAMVHFGVPAITLSISYAAFLNSAMLDVTALLPDGENFEALSMVAGTGRQYLQGLDVRTRHEVVRTVSDDLAKGYTVVITSGALTLIVGLVLLFMKRGKL